GPHHAAQKSMTTMSLPVMVLSNRSEVRASAAMGCSRRGTGKNTSRRHQRAVVAHAEAQAAVCAHQGEQVREDCGAAARGKRMDDGRHGFSRGYFQQVWCVATITRASSARTPLSGASNSGASHSGASDH